MGLSFDRTSHLQAGFGTLGREDMCVCWVQVAEGDMGFLLPFQHSL